MEAHMLRYHDHQAIESTVQPLLDGGCHTSTSPMRPHGEGFPFGPPFSPSQHNLNPSFHPPSMTPHPPSGKISHQRQHTLGSVRGSRPRAELDRRHTTSYPSHQRLQHNTYKPDHPTSMIQPMVPPLETRDVGSYTGINGHDSSGNEHSMKYTIEGSRKPQHLRVATQFPTQQFRYQHPPPSHAHPPHSSVPIPHPPPPYIQHASEHQQIGNGSMYHTPTSRSPPPPSPYSGQPMLPHGPGSPPYVSRSYGPPGPPHQGHLPPPPPPYPRDAQSSNIRPGSGMSISSMLDNGPSRPPDNRFHHPLNGQPVMNGHSQYPEREGHRPQPFHPPQEPRSLTPDAYRSRHHDYTRPSRAYSGGEMQRGRPMFSPEKITFGPPLPTHHEYPTDPRPGPLPPHNSAPQSRRASVSASVQPFLDRPSTGHIHGAFSLQGHVVDHVGVPRPPPPPLSGHVENDRGAPVHGPIDHRPWPNQEQRPSSNPDEQSSKPHSYSFFSQRSHAPHQQHTQAPPLGENLPVYGPAPYTSEPGSRDSFAPQTNGHSHTETLPVYGPLPNPAASSSAPPAPEQSTRYPAPPDGRKYAADTLQHGRLESPLLRHRHLMDRTNSAGSGRLSIGPDKRRAASPLPQAVQGAQAQPKGPTNEPKIKGEFGRMFSGLGSVTPTPTPVELVAKRYSSPTAERDLDAERRASGTPLTGRLDLGDRSGRSASRTGKRNRKVRDDEMGSPTLDLARTLSGRSAKRTRNNYMGVDTTSPVLGRNDSSVPFAAGSARQRSFTPTSYAAFSASKRASQSDRERERAAAERERDRDERKPRTIVSNKAVLDSIKNKPRKHLGSMLYDVKISPESVRPGEGGSRYGFDSKPEILPHFEDKDNSTFTVRVGRRFLAAKFREELIERRNLWGSDIYTDDSDVLAAAIHSGWIKGDWGPNVDLGMLNLNGRQTDNEFRPNGRSSLSVSVSPELSRKSLVNGRNSANETPSVSPSKTSAKIIGQDDVLDAPPRHGPVLPPVNKDAHITVLLLPRLQSYASTVNYGIKSRAWGKAAGTSAHDGSSFMIHKIEWVDESPASRKDERGAGARHRRVAQGMKDRAGLGTRVAKGFNLGGDMAKETTEQPSGDIVMENAPTAMDTTRTVTVGA